MGIELAARDAKGNVIDGSLKRKWLVAFCTRWSPPCNLLVGEFALLGAEASLRDFALGWVDCTPASATAFCGARFAGTVEGYPTVALVAGGRIVRYSAVDRERIAGAIAPWAVAAAAAIDAHAPNSGEPPPGAAVPEEDMNHMNQRRAAFPDGRRGERAHEADEHGELSRARAAADARARQAGGAASPSAGERLRRLARGASGVGASRRGGGDHDGAEEKQAQRREGSRGGVSTEKRAVTECASMTRASELPTR